MVANFQLLLINRKTYVVRNILLLSCFLFSSFGFGQVTFSTQIQPNELLDNLNFYRIHLDDNESGYVSISDSDPTTAIRLFDNDFNFVQDISIPPQFFNGGSYVQYITKTLFDCDPSNIEFLAMTPYSPLGGASAKVAVVREDGTILFQHDGAVALAINNAPYSQLRWKAPIISTNDGTKLFLHLTDEYIGDGGIKVYDLCGDLPNTCCEGSTGELSTGSHNMELVHRSIVFPNPTNSRLTIDLAQPLTGENIQLSLFNVNGELVKEELIQSGQQIIQLDLQSISVGSYFYQIHNGEELIDSGKVVKQ